VLGGPSTQSEHLVTDLRVAYLMAYLVDDDRSVAAGDGGEDDRPHPGHQTRTVLPVGGFDAGRQDPESEPSGPRAGFWHLLDGEQLRIAVLAEATYTHGPAPSGARPVRGHVRIT